MKRDQGADAALDPLRRSLIAAAQAAAAAVRAAAEEDASTEIAGARVEAEALLAEARARGEADAAALLTLERARARHAARAVVLRAQRELYDELVDRAREAAGRLLAEPAARTRLEAIVRDRLGEPAVLRPGADGGVLAEGADDRFLDASVRALVDTALAGVDVEPLWAG
ncbi:MAG TPA: hypothetical protein VMI11_14450 [Actinomycetes bacterium]|nr:hypothetical protein [Actinomycetes bacterium]